MRERAGGTSNGHETQLARISDTTSEEYPANFDVWISLLNEPVRNFEVLPAVEYIIENHNDLSRRGYDRFAYRCNPEQLIKPQARGALVIRERTTREIQHVTNFSLPALKSDVQYFDSLSSCSGSPAVFEQGIGTNVARASTNSRETNALKALPACETASNLCR
jgi:hypothetical protein